MNKGTVTKLTLVFLVLCVISAVISFVTAKGSSLSSTFAIVGTVLGVLAVVGIIYKNIKFKN